MGIQPEIVLNTEIIHSFVFYCENLPKKEPSVVEMPPVQRYGWVLD